MTAFRLHTTMMLPLVVFRDESRIQRRNPESYEITTSDDVIISGGARTIASDTDGIKAVVDEFNATVTANDPDTWINVFTDDALMLPADLPIVSGKDAIKKWGVDSWFTPFNMKLNQVIDELDIADSWALGRGHFTLDVAPKSGGDEINLVGKFLARFDKGSDGSWKYARNAFNWDAPMGG